MALGNMGRLYDTHTCTIATAIIAFVMIEVDKACASYRDCLLLHVVVVDKVSGHSGDGDNHNQRAAW